MNDRSTQMVSAEENLESRLLMLGVWRRRKMLLAWIVISLGIGAFAGAALGTRVYTAKTSLLYDSAAYRKAWETQPPSDASIASMVKLPDILDRTAEAMHLDMPRPDLEEAIKASPAPGSDFIDVSVSMPDARKAYDVSRALNDIFMQRIGEKIRDNVRAELDALRKKVAAAERKLNESDEALRAFLAKSRVTPTDFSVAQSAATLQDLEQTCAAYLIERRALAAELALVEARIANEADRAARERRVASGELAASRARARADHLRTTLDYERDRQVKQADLIQAQLDLDRARKLREKGLISQVDYEKAFTEYQRQKAQASHPEEEREWASLQPAAVPVLPDPIQTSFESQMEQESHRADSLRVNLAALDAKAQRAEMALTHARDLQARLPGLQERYNRLSRNLYQARTSFYDLTADLARAERTLSSPAAASSWLQIAREPELPTEPTRSGTKMIAMVVATGGIFVGFGLAVGSELRDKRIKSPAELPVKLAMPVIGAVTQAAAKALPSAGTQPDFASIARRIREQLPQVGARLLVVSAQHGEGKSLVVTNLARALAARNENVLVVDAESTSPNEALRATIPSESVLGLGEFLRGWVERADDVVWPTRYPNVSCIPFEDKEETGHLVASERMHRLMQEVSQRHSIVLVEGSPLVEEGRTEALAADADAILFVVQNWKYDIPTLRRAIEQLQPTGTPILGAVVTGVDPLYLEKG